MKILSKIWIILILYSCQPRIIDNNESAALSVEPKSDSTAQNNSALEEIVVNKSMQDKGFMDFFGNFMWDSDFQNERIIYPISVNDSQIESKKHWVYNSFYAAKSYIPIIHSDTVTYFQRDVMLDSIKMSIIYFENQIIENFDFRKTQQGWKLTKVNTHIIDSLNDVDFIKFLKHFSSDSIFQLEHIVFPIPYEHLDYDNYYESLYDTLYVEKWRHLNLVGSLEETMTLNINENSDYRMIFFRGIDNGIYVKYIFRKFGNNWKLIKFEDTST